MEYRIFVISLAYNDNREYILKSQNYYSNTNMFSTKECCHGGGYNNTNR